MIRCQDGGGNGKEGNRDDETPDIGSSQELAKGADSLLLTSNGTVGAQELSKSLVATLLSPSSQCGLRDDGELE